MTRAFDNRPPRNHRRMPWSRINAKTRSVIGAQATDANPVIVAVVAGVGVPKAKLVEHGVSVVTKKSAIVTSTWWSVSVKHRVLTRHAVEWRHVELLVNRHVAVSSQGVGGICASFAVGVVDLGNHTPQAAVDAGKEKNATG